MKRIEEVEDLTIRVYAVLKSHQLNFVRQIEEMSREEIMKLKGMDNKNIEELEKKLCIKFK